MTIVVVPMTGMNNYYFSVPIIILIEDLTFYDFIDRYRNVLQKKCQQFFPIYSKVI